MLGFFNKYKLQINIIILFFWCIIIYDSYTSLDFKLIKIIPAIVFIILSLFNIYTIVKEKRKKSRN